MIMTHSPPRGIMDYTLSRQRAGCPNLFSAVARSRPRLHCFGHIHEGWGAKLVTWRSEVSESPTHFADIDNEKSTIIEKLSGLMESKVRYSRDFGDKKRKTWHIILGNVCMHPATAQMMMRNRLSLVLRHFL